MGSGSREGRGERSSFTAFAQKVHVRGDRCRTRGSDLTAGPKGSSRWPTAGAGRWPVPFLPALGAPRRKARRPLPGAKARQEDLGTTHRVIFVCQEVSR